MNDELDISSPESYVNSLADSGLVSEDCLCQILLDEGRLMNSFVTFGTDTYQAAVRLADIVDPVMKRCYDNCSEAAMAADRVPADVEYCEGYASITGLPPLRHAWLLVGGDVAEITHPESRERVIPPADTTYFGVAMTPAQAGDIRGP